MEQRDILGDEFGDHGLHDALNEDFLLGQLFGDDAFVDRLAAGQLVILDALNAIALHVAGAHQHALQSAQTVVVVAVGGRKGDQNFKKETQT